MESDKAIVVREPKPDQKTVAIVDLLTGRITSRKPTAGDSAIMSPDGKYMGVRGKVSTRVPTRYALLTFSTAVRHFCFQPVVLCKLWISNCRKQPRVSACLRVKPSSSGVGSHPPPSPSLQPVLPTIGQRTVSRTFLQSKARGLTWNPNRRRPQQSVRSPRVLGWYPDHRLCLQC